MEYTENTFQERLQTIAQAIEPFGYKFKVFSSDTAARYCIVNGDIETSIAYVDYEDSFFQFVEAEALKDIAIQLSKYRRMNHLKDSYDELATALNVGIYRDEDVVVWYSIEEEFTSTNSKEYKINIDATLDLNFDNYLTDNGEEYAYYCMYLIDKAKYKIHEFYKSNELDLSKPVIINNINFEIDNDVNYNQEPTDEIVNDLMDQGEDKIKDMTSLSMKEQILHVADPNISYGYDMDFEGINFTNTLKSLTIPDEAKAELEKIYRDAHINIYELAEKSLNEANQKLKEEHSILENNEDAIVLPQTVIKNTVEKLEEAYEKKDHTALKEYEKDGADFVFKINNITKEDVIKEADKYSELKHNNQKESVKLSISKPKENKGLER